MRRTKRHRVVRFSADGRTRQRSDVLAGEEPLELRVDGATWTVTMRTPGEDFDLALGFLVSEGVVWSAEQVAGVAYGPGVNPDGTHSYNVVDVRLDPGVAPRVHTHHRHVYTSSACGICGTSSLDAVTRSSRFPVADDDVRVPLPALLGMTERLRTRQQLFADTGGVHAAGLFALDATGGAELLCLREDVGRHNAVDKVVGWALRERGLPLRGCVLQVSGRASFELVQKAQLAGIPVLSAVSAPSALAVELAEQAGMTLVGFSRGDSANVYTGAGRVTV